MPEPEVRYCTTDDGVRIAYSTTGEGTPLVYAPDAPWVHLQLLWQIPEYRRFFQRLAQKHKLIRYDARGSGLSDRNVSDYSLEAYRLDLEAVANHLELERFALFGLTGPVAVSYVARHADRVSHLILWGGFAPGRDFAPSPQMRSLGALLAQDWELFTEAAAHAALGWAAGEPARRFAAVMRECVTQDAAVKALAAIMAFDVTEQLPEVTTPTLILHPRQSKLLAVEVSRALAAQMLNARLVLLEGESNATFLGKGRAQAVVQAVENFLGEGEKVRAEAALPATTITILFTDLEGHTAMMQRLGDATGRDVLREHERVSREALRAHGGTEVKTIGDSFMASFPSAQEAVECAIALQRAFASMECAGERLRIRVGINAGEPIADEDDLFGSSVILASRTKEKAAGGEVLVTDVVRQLVSGKGFLFVDRGEMEMKGFEEPVRLYEVRWS